MQLDFISFPIELKDSETLLSYKPVYGEDGILLRVVTNNRTIVRIYGYQSNDYHQDLKMLENIMENQPKTKEKNSNGYHYL